MTAIENVYNIENVDFNGKLCRTNVASSTAFRGFGAPQAMFCTETIMKHIAEEFKIDVNKVKCCNLRSIIDS
jgi:xanthine dehydrogenase/oxidase